MNCRLVSIDAQSHRRVCACGELVATREAFHLHLFGPTLEELVAEVEAGWLKVDRAWREWRLCRDRIELHREEWVVA